MKLAILGSRGLIIKNIEEHLPPGVTEIVSGGARGVDACAREYARAHGIPFIEFLPDYRRYRRGAPLCRNAQILDYADEVLIFWDGISQGTRWVIRRCAHLGKKATVVRMDPT